MKVYLLTKSDSKSSFLGDNNQVLGIKLAIQSSFKEKQYEFQQIEESEFDSKVLTKEDCVFVAGDHGLLMAKQIKKDKPENRVIWSGHQYLDELDTIETLPDIVALPKTALSKNQKAKLRKNTLLITTSGVAHCVNDTDINEDHSKFKGQLPDPQLFPKQVGIIIAGDAPLPNGSPKYFTKNDAKKQAEDIANYLIANGYDQKDTAIMLTNSRRTGEIDPDTGLVRDPHPHRCGQVDSISKEFNETVNRMIRHSQVFFYDFQFEELKNGPSAYKPMIKQVTNNQLGLWLVSSESTSMVTESNHLYNKGVPVVIYHPSSENSAHLAHVSDLLKQGLVLELSKSKLVKPCRTQIIPAANQIAEAFYSLLSKTEAKQDSAISSTSLEKEFLLRIEKATSAYLGKTKNQRTEIQHGYLSWLRHSFIFSGQNKALIFHDKVLKLTNKTNFLEEAYSLIIKEYACDTHSFASYLLDELNEMVRTTQKTDFIKKHYTKNDAQEIFKKLADTYGLQFNKDYIEDCESEILSPLSRRF